MKPLHPPGTTAFSLTELMAAIVVVSILAALVYGATGKMREQTRLTRDMQTMRSMGASLHLYLADHRGVLPRNQQPVPAKTLAHYLGFTANALDWRNDNATPRNSIFVNGANETAIRRYFTSAFDPHPRPDPLNAFSFNYYIGPNPGIDPGLYHEEAYVRTYLEIQRPAEKIFLIPAWFTLNGDHKFSGTTTATPFRTARNPALKGHFPALFTDGHVSTVDPAPQGMTLPQINNRWLLPKSH